jgi:hypothetical protein
MSPAGISSVALITVGGALSLGCCCPRMPVLAPPARPPVIVQQPQVNPPPNPPMEQKPPPQDVEQFVTKNLGPNDRAGALAPNSPLWAKVRQVSQQRTFKTHNPVGGGFGSLPFSETHPDGGVLIGFFAGEDDGGHIGFLQPIYLTPKGEKAGQRYGVPRRPVQCLKAKPGYALGGVNLRTGGVIDALAVVFMKVDGERLNPADNYSSAQLGGQGGGPGSFTSSGSLLIGIHGKRLEREAFAPAGAPTGLGFLSLQ